eukprot:10596863-Prorocentrum_lima.AAC.1
MNYKPGTTPGEPESYVQQEVEEQHDYSSLSSILGALMWPDICWAVTRVPRAVKRVRNMLSM